MMTKAVLTDKLLHVWGQGVLGGDGTPKTNQSFKSQFCSNNGLVLTAALPSFISGGNFPDTFMQARAGLKAAEFSLKSQKTQFCS